MTLHGRDRNAERDALARAMVDSDFLISDAYTAWRLAQDLQAIAAGQGGV